MLGIHLKKRFSSYLYGLILLSHFSSQEVNPVPRGGLRRRPGLHYISAGLRSLKISHRRGVKDRAFTESASTHISPLDD